MKLYDPVDKKEVKKFIRDLAFVVPIAVTLMTNAVELGDGLNWLFGADIWTWDENTHWAMIVTTIWQIYQCYRQIIKKIIELIDDTYD